MALGLPMLFPMNGMEWRSHCASRFVIGLKMKDLACPGAALLQDV